MASSSKTKLLQQIRDEIVADTRLPLYAYRTEHAFMPVIGEGSHDARVIFIGEAPGLNEAKTGRPFCGAAGRVLDELLASIGLDRAEVYITNTVKDRPPDNRDPLPEEIAAYSPFLARQIEIIQPKVIATLGRFSMNFIFTHFGLGDKLQPISKLHGQAVTAEATFGRLILFPLYHPAAALYSGGIKPALLKDFQTLKRYLS